MMTTERAYYGTCTFQKVNPSLKANITHTDSQLYMTTNINIP